MHGILERIKSAERVACVNLRLSHADLLYFKRSLRICFLVSVDFLLTTLHTFVIL